MVDRKKKNFTCKKTKCMVISKRDNPSYELQIGNVKIMRVQKLNYLGSAVTNAVKCDRISMRH